MLALYFLRFPPRALLSIFLRSLSATLRVRSLSSSSVLLVLLVYDVTMAQERVHHSWVLKIGEIRNTHREYTVASG